MRALVKHGGDRTLESRALSNLGAAYQNLGLFDEARKYLEEGIALCDLIGDRQSHAYNVVNLGGVMLLGGDLSAAKQLFEQGLSEAAVVAMLACAQASSGSLAGWRKWSETTAMRFDTWKRRTGPMG